MLAKYGSFGAQELQRDFDAGQTAGQFAVNSDPAEVLKLGEKQISLEVQADAMDLKESLGDDLRSAMASASEYQVRTIALADERLTVQNRYNQDLLSLERDCGLSSTSHKDALADFRDAEHDKRELRSQLNRAPVRTIPSRIYWAVALAAAVIEIPLNAVAFGILNEVMNLYNTAFAAVVGGGLIGLAHLLGTTFRRVFGSRTVAQVIGRAIGFLAGLATSVAIIIIVSYMRDQLLAVEATNPFDVFDPQSGVAKTVTTAITDALSEWFTGLSSDALQLAFFNGCIVLLASVLAFYHTDPDERYNAAIGTFSSAKARLDKVKAKYARISATITLTFNTATEQIDREARELARNLAEANETIEAVRANARAAGESVLRVRERRKGAFRQGFMQGFTTAGGDAKRLIVGPDQDERKEPEVEGA